MNPIRVKFCNEEGKIVYGELVNPVKVMIEMSEEVLHVEQEASTHVDVVTFDGVTLVAHQVPMLAVIQMKEVVPA